MTFTFQLMLLFEEWSFLVFMTFTFINLHHSFSYNISSFDKVYSSLSLLCIFVLVFFSDWHSLHSLSFLYGSSFRIDIPCLLFLFIWLFLSDWHFLPSLYFCIVFPLTWSSFHVDFLWLGLFWLSYSSFLSSLCLWLSFCMFFPLSCFFSWLLFWLFEKSYNL